MAKLRLVLLSFSVSLWAVSLACSSAQKPTPPPPAPAHAGADLWGDMKPVVSVKELMRDLIDPASDFVFDSVGTFVTKKGREERREERTPKTEEDWERIRFGATTLAEAVYLLKVQRPFAPAGDENNSTGPEPEELSPAQIKAKIEKDPVLWNAKIEALRNVGLEVLDIVKRRKADELWDAGDNLDQACENCHLEFWYPGEKEYLRKLDQRLHDLYGTRGPARKLGMDPK
jgi:hypothetical protein